MKKRPKLPKSAKEVLRAGMANVRSYLLDRLNWHEQNALRLRDAIGAIDDYDHDDPRTHLEALTKMFVGLSPPVLRKRRTR